MLQVILKLHKLFERVGQCPDQGKMEQHDSVLNLLPFTCISVDYPNDAVLL